ncbi:hypothetical protein BC831DRAFT_443582 [Entophlyctis helioformis]|nr:hypothetical protein BC831DRAFT_443582 [Entophlyctis helioformis]
MSAADLKGLRLRLRLPGLPGLPGLDTPGGLGGLPGPGGPGGPGGLRALPPLPPSYVQLQDNVLAAVAEYDFVVERAAVAHFDRLTQLLAREALARKERDARRAAADEQRWLDQQLLQAQAQQSQTDDPPAPAPESTSVSATGGGQGRSASPAPVAVPGVAPPTPHSPARRSLQLGGSSSSQQQQQAVAKDADQQRPKGQQLDYRDFEQGLAPPDPWDSTANERDLDFRMLQEVMGGGGVQPQHGPARPSSRNSAAPMPYSSSPSAHPPMMHHRAASFPYAQPHASHTNQPAPPPYTPFVPGPSPAKLAAQSGSGSNSGSPSPQPPARPAPPGSEPVAGFSSGFASQFQRMQVTDAQPASGSGMKLPTPTMPSLPRMPPPPPVPAPPQTYGAGSAGGSASMSPRHSPPPRIPPRVVFATAQEGELFNSFVQMGFMPDILVRAMRVNGADDKLVLDYAIRATDFANAGYDLDAIDMALAAHRDDPDGVAAFLQAFAGVAELGFPPERIRDALVAKKNSKVDAIEFLMSNP